MSDNGGTAFPAMDGRGYLQAGMTLRDYFAAAVLPSCVPILNEASGTKMDMARTAYAIADAMLKERAK